VSPLCFEPKVGLNVLEEMLRPWQGQIQIFMRTRIIDLEVRGARIQSALAWRIEKGDVIRFRPKFVLDATETGDMLPLARVPYVVGAESKRDTNEPDAAPAPNSGCVQSFTYCFAVENRPAEDHRIPKPPEYEVHRKAQSFTFLLNFPKELGWKGQVRHTMFGDSPPIPNNQSPGSVFGWRRLVAKNNFAGPSAPNDLSLINWPGQDYNSESLLDRPPLDVARILQQAKQVSLAFLYWLQNDVPRDDGDGTGYPQLMLRADVMGTSDGLSMAPYIRESRRLQVHAPVVEQDIVGPGVRARWFSDSVGTGFYMVDIHPCIAGERGRNVMPKPFQIPMSALIPQQVSNLLVAGKAIGVTHITNGAFRVHPVEWNVGEAAGTIASLALQEGALPAPRTVQLELARAGVPLVWFDDLSPEQPHFAAVQLASLAHAYPLNPYDLHASVDSPVTRGEAAQALAALFLNFNPASATPLDVSASHPQAGAIALAVEQGWMATDHRNWFHPDLPFNWADWREDRFPRRLAPLKTTGMGPVRRGELAERLLETTVLEAGAR
jgi:hypothetical protein